ncbi:MAG: hypothetical protein M3P08_09585 [Thermoproteota archaeon]|nr:hypothetical protein [Thermoproteota archaeon]
MIWKTEELVISHTIKAIKLVCPKIIVEPLIPDFQGNDHSIRKIVNANPEVISHNIETVLRLSAKIRDGSTFNFALE